MVITLTPATRISGEAVRRGLPVEHVRHDGARRGQPGHGAQVSGDRFYKTSKNFIFTYFTLKIWTTLHTKTTDINLSVILLGIFEP
jgi:hypothetical protein